MIVTLKFGFRWGILSRITMRAYVRRDGGFESAEWSEELDKDIWWKSLIPNKMSASWWKDYLDGIQTRFDFWVYSSNVTRTRYAIFRRFLIRFLLNDSNLSPPLSHLLNLIFVVNRISLCLFEQWMPRHWRRECCVMTINFSLPIMKTLRVDPAHQQTIITNFPRRFYFAASYGVQGIIRKFHDKCLNPVQKRNETIIINNDTEWMFCRQHKSRENITSRQTKTKAANEILSMHAIHKTKRHEMEKEISIHMPYPTSSPRMNMLIRFIRPLSWAVSLLVSDFSFKRLRVNLGWL